MNPSITRKVTSDIGVPGSLGSTEGDTSGRSDESSPARNEQIEDIRSRSVSSVRTNAFPVGFADLFKGSKQETQNSSCTYMEPENMNIIELEEADVDRVQNLWGYCLLGCFAGRFPGLKAVKSMVDNWKIPCNILLHFNGWVVFQFEKEAYME